MRLQSKLLILATISVTTFGLIAALTMTVQKVIFDERLYKGELKTQTDLWHLLTAQASQSLRTDMDQLLEDPQLAPKIAARDSAAIIKALAPMLEQPTPNFDVAQILDLDGETVFTTQGSSLPLLDELAVQQTFAQGRWSGILRHPERGFLLLEARTLRPSSNASDPAASSIEDPLLIAITAKKASEILSQYEGLQNREATLIDLRGTVLSGDVNGEFLTVLQQIPLRSSSVIETDAYHWLATPLTIGSTFGQEEDRSDLIGLLLVQGEKPDSLGGALRFLAGFGLFLIIIVAVAIRYQLRSVRQAVLLLGGKRMQSESQTLFQAVETAKRSRERIDEITLQSQRHQKRQERLIRGEIVKLANNLDEVGRQEMLELLHSERSVPKGIEELGLLAAVLGQLSQRVSAQHQRLNDLVEQLREAVVTRARLAGLEQELSIARDVQLAMVPQVYPPINGHRVAGQMLPAKEVGGDFFDFFALDEHRYALLIGDVSGKGVPAALFMAISRTLLRATSQYAPSPAACVESVNSLLAADNAQLLFVTLFYAIYDSRSGDLDYVNAGHPAPIILSQDGTLRKLPSTGDMAMAVIEDAAYHTGHERLMEGETLILYTDGVSEATNPSQDLFGEVGLETYLIGQNLITKYPHILLNNLLSELIDYANGREQADDITVLILHRTRSDELS